MTRFTFEVGSRKVFGVMLFEHWVLILCGVAQSHKTQWYARRALQCCQAYVETKMWLRKSVIGARRPVTATSRRTLHWLCTHLYCAMRVVAFDKILFSSPSQEGIPPTFSCAPQSGVSMTADNIQRDTGT